MKFLSCEPLIGPLPSPSVSGIDWCIVGGESGPQQRGAQDLDPRHQAAVRPEAGVAFFFKQWGGSTPKAGELEARRQDLRRDARHARGAARTLRPLAAGRGEHHGGRSGRIQAGLGWTTTVKLEVLKQYLSAFTKACQRSREVVYIDLFAGVPSNTACATAAPPSCSDLPSWRCRPTHPSRGCATSRSRTRPRPSSTKLRELYPGRDIKVAGGDCNAVIDELLAGLQPWDWAPTFAFIDPDGMEVAWETIEALAAHEAQPDQGRALDAVPGRRADAHHGARSDEGAEADYLRMDRLFGCSTWEHIYDARRRNESNGTEGARSTWT